MNPPAVLHMHAHLLMKEATVIWALIHCSGWWVSRRTEGNPGRLDRFEKDKLLRISKMCPWYPGKLGLDLWLYVRGEEQPITLQDFRSKGNTERGTVPMRTHYHTYQNQAKTTAQRACIIILDVKESTCEGPKCLINIFPWNLYLYSHLSFWR